MFANVHVKDHFLNHLIGYGFVVVGFIVSVSWYAGVAFMDGRHVLRLEHKQSVEAFSTQQSAILETYQQTELENQLREVRKDLSRSRRDKRRFEAYLSADPDGALAAARAQTVRELEDEVDELEEERDIIVDQLGENR